MPCPRQLGLEMGEQRAVGLVSQAQGSSVQDFVLCPGKHFHPISVCPSGALLQEWLVIHLIQCAPPIHKKRLKK